LSNIELANERAGIEELVFSNSHQRVPWQLSVGMNRKTNLATFSLHTNYRGCNVNQELEGIRFEQLTSLGGSLKFLDQGTGFLLGCGEVAAGQKDAPPAHWVRLIEILAMIQRKSQTALQIPDSRTISREEVENIFRTAQILDAGYFCSDVAELEFALDWEAAKKFIESGVGGSLMTEHQNQSTTILGKAIDLGPVKIVYHNFSIEPQALEVIKQGISDKREKVPMKLTFKEKIPCRAIYPKWNPKLAESAP
jgi:hypothetical protein